MNSYKIADIIVNMQPKYEKMKTLSQTYLVDYHEKADITIFNPDELMQQIKNENPHLPMYEIENIFTLSQFLKQLSYFNGIVFHASAIEFEGRAYLFSGNSGAGKTTHTKLWQKYFGSDKVTVINDDKPVIRNIDNKFWVYGSPWCGSSRENTNVKVPLEAIIFLQQQKENWIKTADNVNEIVYNILNQTRHKLLPDEVDTMFGFIEKLIANVKIYNMGCTISNEAVETAAKTILPCKGNNNDTKI